MVDVSDNFSGPKNDPRYVLLVGDIHGTAAHIESAYNSARKHGFPVDVILQVGDFGVWPGGEKHLDRVARLSAGLDKPIYFIRGNHEDYTQINAWESELEESGEQFYEVRPNVFYIPSGTRWEWSGRRFGALGGAYSVDSPYRWAGYTWWPVDEEVKVQNLRRLGAEKLDILVGHDTSVKGRPNHHWKLTLPDHIEMQASVSQALTQVAMDYTEPKFFVHGHWHVPIRRMVECGNAQGYTDYIGLSTRDSQNMNAHPDQTFVAFDLDEMQPYFGSLWNPQP